MLFSYKTVATPFEDNNEAPGLVYSLLRYLPGNKTKCLSPLDGLENEIDLGPLSGNLA